MGDRRYRQRSSDLYSPEQTERVIQAAGGTVAGEVDTDWIIFCPFHYNYNTPAAEIDKEKGTFFCFACRHIDSLAGYVKKMTGVNDFQALRLIKKYETSIDFMGDLDNALAHKPEYVPFDEEVVERLHKQALSSDRAMAYFTGRGILNLEEYKLGYSEAQDMVTIPQ